jgi:hypothetical protein
MSENKREERKKYVLDIEDHLSFKPDAEIKILTQRELCDLVSPCFKAAFADFECCSISKDSAQPYMILSFNHYKHNKDGIYACEITSKKKSGNSVVDIVQEYDRRTREGDRFFLTEDGKDVIKPLLLPRFNNNNNPNWGNIVTDIALAQSFGRFANFTEVKFIDIREICKLLFGDHDEEDNSMLDYSINFTIDGNNNYVFQITKVNTRKVFDMYDKLGFINNGIHGYYNR